MSGSIPEPEPKSYNWQRRYTVWLRKYITLIAGVILFAIGIYLILVPDGESMTRGVQGIFILMLAFCVTATGLGVIAAMSETKR